MANERNKKGETGPPPVPGWVVTYGDMMSLLLTFFVLLLSFSSITQEKFEAGLMSIQGALGLLPENTSITYIQTPSNQAPFSARTLERMARELRRRLQVQGRESEVDLKYDKGGLKISLPSHVLFDTARADLRPSAEPVLHTVADVLKGVPGAFIEIRGHTDSRPLINTHLYRDNYDLSYARAKSVMSYLNRDLGMPRSEFEVIACGPSQPVATNDTEEGRQANRRVELYVRGANEQDNLEDLKQRLNQLEHVDVVETEKPHEEKQEANN